MAKKPKSLMTWVLAFSFAASLAIAGCARHPNEQELQLLDEAKQAASSAEQSVRDCNNEKADLENQLSQKKRELQRAVDEKDAVARRLGE